ncbi:hypothetical protein ABH935_009327 [Catenulispora sp. GAS73]
MRVTRLRTGVAIAVAGLIAVLTPVGASAAPSAPRPGPVVGTNATLTPEAVAKATGKRVLVSSLTTPNSETYANPDGTRTFEEHVLPVRQRTASGWAPMSAAASAQAAKATAAPQVVTPQVQTPPGQTAWAEVYAGNFANGTYWGGDNTPCPGASPTGLCAKVGFSYDFAVTVRSFFQFGLGALAGKHIQSAAASFTEVYAPSCDARQVFVSETGPISNAPGNATTWNHEPNWVRSLGSANVVFGDTKCAAPANAPGVIGVDAGLAVTDGLANGSNDATFMLNAVETDHVAWRMFAINPTLVVTYDSYPDVPVGLLQGFTNSPGQLGCGTAANPPYIGTAAPSLHATVTDADGGLVAAHFQWFVSGPYNLVGEATTPMAGSGAPFSVNVPPGAFADGSAMAWRVEGTNGISTSVWSPWCYVTVDLTPPGVAPTVTSSVYPEAKPGLPGAFGGGVGQTGAFMVTANGVPDVAGFRYCEAAGQCTPTTFVAADQLGGGATLNVSPVAYGPNNLYVQSVDRAGNLGPMYHTDSGSAQPVEGYHFLAAHGSPAVGVWHMDNFGTVSAVTDTSGNHHDGTVATVPSSAYWTGGRIGEALQLDGTAGSAATSGPVLDTSQSFSVAAWVRLDRADGAWHTVVSQDGSQASGFYLQYAAGGINNWAFAMTQSDIPSAVADRAVATGPVQAGVWTHLVGEYDAGAGLLKIYVNGHLAGTAPHTGAWDAGGALQIGRAEFNGAATDFWPGAIDEVRAYQRVLPDNAAATDGEDNVHDLATGNTVQQAFLPLSDGSGTAAADRSGNYDNGTLAGGATWVTGHAEPHAVHFDEASGQIATTSPAVRTDSSFTVSAEVKLDTVDGNVQTIASEDGQHTSVFALQVCPNRANPTDPSMARWCFSLAPSDVANPVWQVVDSAQVPQTGTWTQVAGVYDAAAQSVSIYVDGALDGTQGVSPPVNTVGNLVIGRAKQNDASVAYLGGSVDDVHAYTGVLTGDQISAEYQQELAHQVSTPVDNYPGQLTSWYQAGRGHFVTTGPVPSGYYVEGPLGLLAPAGATNTSTLYSCENTFGQFVSLDANCENNPSTSTANKQLSVIGSIYNSPPVGVPSQAIYRCAVTGGDHFVSSDPKCYSSPNITPESLLGYVRAYSFLNRYARTDVPQDHAAASSTLLVSPGAAFVYSLAGYHFESSLGLLGQAGGDIPVYTCVNGSDEFLATKSDCGGGGVQAVAWIGNLWSTPPAATATARLFDCKVTSTGERFDSDLANCEGQTVVGPLGYLITKL